MKESILASVLLIGLLGGCGSKPPTDLAYEATDAAEMATEVAQATPNATLPVPPPAVVDGVTYSGAEQTEIMTQAARDAGMDEATARRTGEEAAILCNGNPDCLR